MRSVIKQANAKGIAAIVEQQFFVAGKIIAKGLVPIIEPEVDIHSADKSSIEEMLKDELIKQLNLLSPDQKVILKLTLPDKANFYADCINQPNVIKVVALSGGYTRHQANELVAANNNMIASFSRALTEGLSAKQTEPEFNNMLDNAINSIFVASKT